MALLLVRRRPWDYRLAVIVGAGTLLALLYFVVPFGLVLGWHPFAGSLKQRFLLRSSGSGSSFGVLLSGYWESFAPYLVLAALCVCGAVVDASFRQRVLARCRKLWWLLLAIALPLGENVALKQHAIEYDYDRFKLIIGLIVFFAICCVSMRATWRKYFVTAVVICASVSMAQYAHSDRNYQMRMAGITYDGQFIATSRVLDDKSAVFAASGEVRGWVGFTLDRSVFEDIYTDNALAQLAQSRHTQRAVWLLGPEYANQLFVWKNALVYNFRNNSVEVYGVATKAELKSHSITVAPVVAGYLAKSPTASVRFPQGSANITRVSAKSFGIDALTGTYPDHVTYSISLRNVQPNGITTNSITDWY
jgi:hypothetical protein